MAHNPILHARTKHKEIDLLFIREKVIGKELTIVHILGDDQWVVLLNHLELVGGVRVGMRNISRSVVMMCKQVVVRLSPTWCRFSLRIL